MYLSTYTSSKALQLANIPFIPEASDEASKEALKLLLEFLKQEALKNTNTDTDSVSWTIIIIAIAIMLVLSMVLMYQNDIPFGPKFMYPLGTSPVATEKKWEKICNVCYQTGTACKLDEMGKGGCINFPTGIPSMVCTVCKWTSADFAVFGGEDHTEHEDKHTNYLKSITKISPTGQKFIEAVHQDKNGNNVTFVKKLWDMYNPNVSSETSAWVSKDTSLKKITEIKPTVFTYPEVKSNETYSNSIYDDSHCYGSYVGCAGTDMYGNKIEYQFNKRLPIEGRYPTFTNFFTRAVAGMTQKYDDL